MVAGLFSGLIGGLRKGGTDLLNKAFAPWFDDVFEGEIASWGGLNSYSFSNVRLKRDSINRRLAMGRLHELQSGTVSTFSVDVLVAIRKAKYRLKGVDILLSRKVQLDGTWAEKALGTELLTFFGSLRSKFLEDWPPSPLPLLVRSRSAEMWRKSVFEWFLNVKADVEAEVDGLCVNISRSDFLMTVKGVSVTVKEITSDGVVFNLVARDILIRGATKVFSTQLARGEVTVKSNGEYQVNFFLDGKCSISVNENGEDFINKMFCTERLPETIKEPRDGWSRLRQQAMAWGITTARTPLSWSLSRRTTLALLRRDLARAFVFGIDFWNGVSSRLVSLELFWEGQGSEVKEKDTDQIRNVIETLGLARQVPLLGFELLLLSTINGRNLFAALDLIKEVFDWRRLFSEASEKFFGDKRVGMPMGSLLESITKKRSSENGKFYVSKSCLDDNRPPWLSMEAQREPGFSRLHAMSTIEFIEEALLTFKEVQLTLQSSGWDEGSRLSLQDYLIAAFDDEAAEQDREVQQEISARAQEAKGCAEAVFFNHERRPIPIRASRARRRRILREGLKLTGPPSALLRELAAAVNVHRKSAGLVTSVTRWLADHGVRSFYFGILELIDGEDRRVEITGLRGSVSEDFVEYRMASLIIGSSYHVKMGSCSVIYDVGKSPIRAEVNMPYVIFSPLSKVPDNYFILRLRSRAIRRAMRDAIRAVAIGAQPWTIEVNVGMVTRETSDQLDISAEEFKLSTKSIAEFSLEISNSDFRRSLAIFIASSTEELLKLATGFV